MFSEMPAARRRGRPAGPTPQGEKTRDRLYATATRMIAQRGYEATTLRDIAKEARVSVGLLYRYFPSKQSVIVALYDELSADFAQRAGRIPDGKWRDRFIFALETSLEVLRPHRLPLRALIPVLVGDPDDGVFGEGSAFSRERVQGVFEAAVTGAADAPKAALTGPLGRLLYLMHLGVLLWWLLDRTPGQRATAALVTLMQQTLPSAALALRLPVVRRFLTTMDGLIRDGLFGAAASEA